MEEENSQTRSIARHCDNTATRCDFFFTPLLETGTSYRVCFEAEPELEERALQASAIQAITVMNQKWERNFMVMVICLDDHRVASGMTIINCWWERCVFAFLTTDVRKSVLHRAYHTACMYIHAVCTYRVYTIHRVCTYMLYGIQRVCSKNWVFPYNRRFFSCIHGVTTFVKERGTCHCDFSDPITNEQKNRGRSSDFWDHLANG